VNKPLNPDLAPSVGHSRIRQTLDALDALAAKEEAKARAAFLARAELRRQMREMQPIPKPEKPDPKMAKPAPARAALRAEGRTTRHFMTQSELHHLERLFREGYTPRRIAEILGLHLSTIYNRLTVIRTADRAKETA
jgi:hypothetical protein